MHLVIPRLGSIKVQFSSYNFLLVTKDLISNRRYVIYLVPTFEREKTLGKGRIMIFLGWMQRVVARAVVFTNMIFTDRFTGEFAQRRKGLKISFSFSYLHWRKDTQNCTKSRRTLKLWRNVAKKNFLGFVTITGIGRRQLMF